MAVSIDRKMLHILTSGRLYTFDIEDRLTDSDSYDVSKHSYDILYPSTNGAVVLCSDNAKEPLFTNTCEYEFIDKYSSIKSLDTIEYSDSEGITAKGLTFPSGMDIVVLRNSKIPVIVARTIDFNNITGTLDSILHKMDTLNYMGIALTAIYHDISQGTLPYIVISDGLFIYGLSSVGTIFNLNVTDMNITGICISSNSTIVIHNDTTIKLVVPDKRGIVVSATNVISVRYINESKQFLAYLRNGSVIALPF
jgi:hypothetical protein